MLYLEYFTFPDSDREFDFFVKQKRTCYDSFYPFQILSRHHLRRIDFEPVTILYGGNGSGKTTVLNVIGEKLQLARDSVFNKSNFFQDYLDFCDYKLKVRLPVNSRVITSDDVFDYMLNIRSMNEGIDRKREKLVDQYYSTCLQNLDMHHIPEAIGYKKSCSKFVKSRLEKNKTEMSNGETAFQYFVDSVGDEALVLMDEPENSLSANWQNELMVFLTGAIREFSCQLVIATHSPFLLSLPGARIYDLDAEPIQVSEWYKLENMRSYFELFDRNRALFEN